MRKIKVAENSAPSVTHPWEISPDGFGAYKIYKQFCLQNAQKKGLIIKYVGDKNRLPTPNDYYSILSPRTRVVSFASGFNLTGDRLDEIQISNIVKKYNDNIFVVVDATQSIQHRKIDVKLSNIDYCSS